MFLFKNSSFLKNGASLLKKRQEDVLSAAFVISISSAISILLGLVKYRLLAANFGDEIISLDSFFVASKFTEAIFEVLIFGTIALAFIPVFSKFLSKEKLEKAWSFSSSMINLGLIIFVILTALTFIFAPQFAQIIAPGLIKKDPSTQAQIAHLLQVMVISQLFFAISIFFTGILHSFQRFIIPALASVFYNGGIIISIIFLSPVVGIYAPAIGMIIGALLHFVIQIPLIFSLGFKFHFNLNLRDKDVRETISLMWPRSVALAALRISDLINIALASIGFVGSVTAFSLAQILQGLPLTLFAGSIAQAALPTLSLYVHAQKKDQFKTTFVSAFHQILFLILLAATIIAILRIPAVRLVFGAKELPWDTTVLAGRLLIAFSVGIAAQAASLLLTRAFYAIRDSYTPVKVNLISISVNISLSFLFMIVLKLPLIYLAIAFSTGAIINAILLFYFLDRRVHFEKKALIVPAVKMGLISLITAASLYVPMKLLDQLVFDTTRTIGLVLLTAVATGVGVTVYVFLSWTFKVKEIYIFWAFSRRVMKWPSKIAKSAASSSIETQKTDF